MIIAAEYSFNDGKKYIQKHFPSLLKETKLVIARVNASQSMGKVSKEKTMKGKRLYSPISPNNSFKEHFLKLDWLSHREPCDYPTSYYTKNYSPQPPNKGAFRDMDFVKGRLGVEVQ